jgi:copper homeostasis protein
MVRPRTGDFLYSEPELSVMLHDIAEFRAVGVVGVVFGVLEADGTVDIRKLTRLALDTSA